MQVRTEMWAGDLTDEADTALDVSARSGAGKVLEIEHQM